MGQRVKISQCMIVKNEEKNIRQALSWGKGYLYEQIVVDTGSTDRTVEIAKELGAKIYHFQWIGDFAAAKNYAISKAKGDWIAFLDADEYFTPEDVKKLYNLLDKIEKQRQESVKRRCVIQSALLELNDAGKVFSTTVQNRVFFNTPHIRYINKIHEKLKYSGPGRMICLDATKSLAVYHTGYTESVYRETDKLDRNIGLLRQSVEEDPEDYEAWSYLGDSYYAAKQYEEAENAFRTALTHTSKIVEERRGMTYFGLMRVLALKVEGKAEGDTEAQMLALREKAREEGIEFPDLDFWIGEWMYLHGKKEEAVRYLEASLRELEEYHGTAGLMITGDLEIVYGMLSHCSMELGDKPAAVRYGVLVLRMNRYVDAALETILALLQEEPGQSSDPSATLQFLEKLYDFAQIRDRLYVMKAAKKRGFQSLYDRLYSQMDPKEQAWLDARPKSDFRLEPEKIKETYPKLPCANEVDLQFVSLIEEIKKVTEETLSENLRERLSALQKKHGGDYRGLLRFFEKYPFWGRLSPELGEYEVLEGRIRALKGHVEDFIWLYSRLEDYRSRKTLLAILENWLHLNVDLLSAIRENGTLYFDIDLIPSGRGKVFVDLGAYIGDSTLNFIRNYGEDYSRIYCYEITPESVDRLKQNLRYYPNIEIRQKAAGDAAVICRIRENEDPAANTICFESAAYPAVAPEGAPIEEAALETAGIPGPKVEMETLDAGIEEAVSFIKIDIEGGEQRALKGCERHIREEHPKLAVSTYHGYEDIWKIPRLIDGMDPSYHFYMRHYGGNLIPTEFILYAI